MRRVNHGTITGALSWYKIWPLNGFNLIRAKQTLRRDGKVCVKVLGAVTQAKSYFSDGIWQILCHHGIIEPQHLIDPRRMALLKEP